MDHVLFSYLALLLGELRLLLYFGVIIATEYPFLNCG